MKSVKRPILKHFFCFCTIVASALAMFSMGCAHQEHVANATPDTQANEKSEVVVLPSSKMPVDYVIGPGDVLEISVWKNEDLSRIVVVLPDGTITFPLLGRFVAGGKTVEQLQKEMERQVSRYVPEPELTILIQQVNSMVVYVIGKVNRPGHFALKWNIDVLQALSMAGGLNIFADQQDIRIFRKTAGKTKVMTFDYKSVTEDAYVKGNILLQAGDVIVVK
ncbi:polysaccharide export protein [Desulfosarcina variabilis str. Montpellier]|uniref:polysaccharide biosynthesis/export family protein n=1 Tax=Desulfosarcina variabilis TaxID=2300 RepID=UPI003AFACCB6